MLPLSATATLVYVNRPGATESQRIYIVPDQDDIPVNGHAVSDPASGIPRITAKFCYLWPAAIRLPFEDVSRPPPVGGGLAVVASSHNHPLPLDTHTYAEVRETDGIGGGQLCFLHPVARGLAPKNVGGTRARRHGRIGKTADDRIVTRDVDRIAE